MPLGTTTLTWLAIAAVVLAALALVLSVVALGRSKSGGARRTGSATVLRRRRSGEPLNPQEVTAEIEALHMSSASALRHVAVVRYDAFGDMGGHLSWSLALLDDEGDGVVLTSIHGRSDSRTYAKNVSAWTANQQLSPEESEAISFAHRPSG